MKIKNDVLEDLRHQYGSSGVFYALAKDETGGIIKYIRLAGRGCYCYPDISPNELTNAYIEINKMGLEFAGLALVTEPRFSEGLQTHQSMPYGVDPDVELTTLSDKISSNLLVVRTMYPDFWIQPQSIVRHSIEIV